MASKNLLNPVIEAILKGLQPRANQIRQEGNEIVAKIKETSKKDVSMMDALKSKKPELAQELSDITMDSLKARSASIEGDNESAMKILDAVRKKYQLPAVAAPMTLDPEGQLMAAPTPESNVDALKTGIARGYDQTMSNEGWLLGLASALGAEGANELRAKLAEQRNPAMGDQENELVRTIGEIIGSMSPGAL